MNNIGEIRSQKCFNKFKHQKDNDGSDNNESKNDKSGDNWNRFRYNINDECIFDDARIFPEVQQTAVDDELINFEKNGRESVNMGSLRVMVVHLTSPSSIDYNFICDFFLTYRNFTNSHTLMKLLLTRLIWSLYYIKSDKSQHNKIGKLTLLRTFIVFRHWILNYFDDDFMHDYKLCNSFSSFINYLMNETSLVIESKDYNSVHSFTYEKKILADLKYHWIFKLKDLYSIDIDKEHNHNNKYSFLLNYTLPIVSSEFKLNANSNFKYMNTFRKSLSVRRSMIVSMYNEKQNLSDSKILNSDTKKVDGILNFGRSENTRFSFNTKSIFNNNITRPISSFNKEKIFSFKNSSFYTKKIAKNLSLKNLKTLTKNQEINPIIDTENENKDVFLLDGFTSNFMIKFPSCFFKFILTDDIIELKEKEKSQFLFNTNQASFYDLTNLKDPNILNLLKLTSFLLNHSFENINFFFHNEISIVNLFFFNNDNSNTKTSNNIKSFQNTFHRTKLNLNFETYYSRLDILITKFIYNFKENFSVFFPDSNSHNDVSDLKDQTFINNNANFETKKKENTLTTNGLNCIYTQKHDFLSSEKRSCTFPISNQYRQINNDKNLFDDQIQLNKISNIIKIKSDLSNFNLNELKKKNSIKKTNHLQNLKSLKITKSSANIKSVNYPKKFNDSKCNVDIDTSLSILSDENIDFLDSTINSNDSGLNLEFSRSYSTKNSYKNTFVFEDFTQGLNSVTDSKRKSCNNLNLNTLDINKLNTKQKIKSFDYLNESISNQKNSNNTTHSFINENVNVTDTTNNLTRHKSDLVFNKKLNDTTDNSLFMFDKSFRFHFNQPVLQKSNKLLNNFFNSNIKSDLNKQKTSNNHRVKSTLNPGYSNLTDYMGVNSIYETSFSLYSPIVNILKDLKVNKNEDARISDSSVIKSPERSFSCFNLFNSDKTKTKNTTLFNFYFQVKKKKKDYVFIDLDIDYWNFFSNHQKLNDLNLQYKSIYNDINANKNELNLNSDNLLQLSMEYALHSSFVFGFDSYTIASHFTVIEKDLLQNVDWRDLIGLKWEKNMPTMHSWLEVFDENTSFEKNNSINLIVCRFNLMVNWVESQIFLTKNLFERVALICKFIHISLSCFLLQNFSTLFQIVLGLTSYKIRKLRNTWKKVPFKDLKILEKLQEITSPSKNFSRLRVLMNCINPLKGCVPFLGLYLSDLVSNLEKNKILKTVNSRIVFASNSISNLKKDQRNIPNLTVREDIINFMKYRISTGIIKFLCQCIVWSLNYSMNVNYDLLSRCLYIETLTENESQFCFEFLVDP